MKNMKKDGRNILIASLLAIVLFMSIGYAAFAQTLNLNSTATISGEWDIEITGITASSVTGNAKGGTPTYTSTSATFNPTLLQPGDTVTYTITVENKGNIDAKFSSMNLTKTAGGSPAIIYSSTDPSSELAAGASTTFTVTATYDSTVTEVPDIKTKSITGTVEYVQA